MSTRRTASQKMAVLAGSLTALAAAPSVDADIVFVSGSPVTLSVSDPGGAVAIWDIDGADGIDFSLFRDAATPGYIFLASGSSGGAPYNGRGLIAPFYTDNVQALAPGFLVGPTLAAYTWGSNTFGGYRNRNMMTPTGGIGYDWNYGFATGANYFGFRFDSAGGGRHYGWAIVDFDTAAGTVTITSWAYETFADTPIAVGATAVPEPATNALLLLGLGAQGLASFRRRRQKGQTADTAEQV